jgi:hypothetical protein
VINTDLPANAVSTALLSGSECRSLVTAVFICGADEYDDDDEYDDAEVAPAEFIAVGVRDGGADAGVAADRTGNVRWGVGGNGSGSGGKGCGCGCGRVCDRADCNDAI